MSQTHDGRQVPAVLAADNGVVTAIFRKRTLRFGLLDQIDDILERMHFQIKIATVNYLFVHIHQEVSGMNVKLEMCLIRTYQRYLRNEF